MNTRWDVAGAFLIGFVVSLGFTPFLRKVALKLNYVDHPETKKAHKKPTPLLGGAAIYLAVFTAVLFSMDFNDALLGVFWGATMLFALGLIDDKVGMLPEMKLCVQALAALTAFKFGLRVTTIDDYYLCMAFTVFWIVGITNAFNLLDNLNGLSSGIAAISSIFFGIMAYISGDFLAASLAAAVAGGSIGFLRYNFPRAQIFMGDTGSLVLGFISACLAILGSWKTDVISLSLAIPVLTLAYPIFDTTLVTIIRLKEGRSVFQGGKDHSSHILAMAGLKKRRAVLLIFGISFLLGVSALIVKISPVPLGWLTLIITVILMLSFGLRLLFIRRKMVWLKHAKQNRAKKNV